MNLSIFENIRKLSLIEAISKGCEYAVDKQGFTEFAILNWNKGNGDFVCAVVATAIILKSNNKHVYHDLHVFDFMFNRSNKADEKLINQITKYFDDEDGALTAKYFKAVNSYNEIDEIYGQIQKMNRTELIPLIKRIDFCKLMDYNNKSVLITASVGTDNGDKKTKIKQGTYKIKMYGSSLKDMKVRFGATILPLVGIEKGVVSIQDPESLDLVYQNLYLDNDKFSDVQKTGFIYGVDEAKKFSSRRVTKLIQDDAQELAD